ncbi:TPA: ead/Ea22-like family protein, partial [Klebsiella pneumoniae]|nr:ead/Ea22-like family protein [Klebsiella pneumoniae]
MTTDITELAQSMKAAADREMICRDGAETSEIWERTVTPENILALVEALEKAQRYIEELREWNAGLAQEPFERQQIISELEPIRAAAEKLVRCKGRYHSEQNYRALAALFGVNTPDLPPLDGEPRA